MSKHLSSVGRGPVVLAAALALGFVACLVAFGWHTDASAEHAVAQRSVAHAGCTEHALRFQVSDDPADVQRQMAFERSGAEVPAAAVHARPLPWTPLLHAVTHGYVTLLYRPGALTAAARAAAADLVASARSKNVSVLAAPAPQQPALVVLRTGMRLSCTSAGVAQIRAARRFAAQQFTILR